MPATRGGPCLNPVVNCACRKIGCPAELAQFLRVFRSLTKNQQLWGAESPIGWTPSGLQVDSECALKTLSKYCVKGVDSKVHLESTTGTLLSKLVVVNLLAPWLPGYFEPILITVFSGIKESAESRFKNLRLGGHSIITF